MVTTGGSAVPAGRGNSIATERTKEVSHLDLAQVRIGAETRVAFRSAKARDFRGANGDTH